MLEEWRYIDDSFNYKISSLGRIYSCQRYAQNGNGKRIVNGRILKLNVAKNGYSRACLNGSKTVWVHQLVAVAFLGHKIGVDGFVVNHINFNRTDNSLKNLELISQRENTNKKHIKSSSKYIGVTKLKTCDRWQSYITINGKAKYLGLYKTELQASDAYQIELNKTK